MNLMLLASTHNDILFLLVQIFVLLLFARTGGELFKRMGQPSVVGEILAGIILGPSLIGSIPLFSEWIIENNSYGTNLIEVISLIGAMLLLLITGLETDLELIKHHSRRAFGTAIGGLIVPLFLGFIFCFFIPDNLLVDPSKRLIFSLFVATAISVSAIPVIAKVLIDLKLIRRDIGQIIIAAGMIDDTVAWILLSIVLGLIELGVVTTQNVFISIGKVLAFISISFFIGKWIAAKTATFAQNSIQSEYKFLTILILFSFGFGAIAHSLKLESVLGAFVAGIIFSRVPAIPRESFDRLESITFGFFAPVFFAFAGLKVRLEPLLNPELLIIGLGFIVVATSSKIFGAYAGARIFGKTDHWTSLSFGAGLNARGAIQIIIATVGLSFGIISDEIFSLIVIMAVVTSLMTPFMLRWTLKHVIPEAAELKRLQQEERLRDNILYRFHRVLLPVRMREISHATPAKIIEAKIIERLAKKISLNVTLFTISDRNNKAESLNFLNILGSFFKKISINKKVMESKNTLECILDEVRKDYDLLIVGATERKKESATLFNPIVDNLVRLSPCTSIVVQSSGIYENWSPSRILVPSNGSTASKRAAEVAFGIAYENDDQVHILNIIENKFEHSTLDVEGSLKERRLTFAHQTVDKLKKLGESLGVNTFTEIEIAEDPETAILKTSSDLNIDLIILGTEVRPGSDKLYLGPRVERILNNATCPVLIVNSF